MIDTQEKLNEFVKEHRFRILAQAMAEYVEGQDDDTWGTYRLNHEEQCDFNTYRPEDEDRINIIAYALREFSDGTIQVNCEIGCLIADIVWKDCEAYMTFGG